MEITKEEAQIIKIKEKKMIKETVIIDDEEELDEKLLSEAKEYNQKHPRTYTHEEVKQELGL